MNSVVLIGNLARDVELSYTPSTQMAVAKFTLAVQRMKRRDQGDDEAGADFIRITVFGKQAENCEKYLSKGRKAAVHGRIQTGSYKNRDGVTVYTTDVIADNVEFLGGGQAGGQAGEPARSGSGGGKPAQEADLEGSFEDLPDSFQAADDDIPF